MIRSLVTIFRLSQAYAANGLIYRLRALPFVKKLLPAKLYGCKGLKDFAAAVMALLKVIWAFMGKFLYLWVFLVLPLNYMDGTKAADALYIMWVLSLAGGFLNGEMFNPTTEKYYAVVLMHMNAKNYVLASYFWFLVKLAVTFLPASLVMGSMAGMPPGFCLLIPVMVVGSKCVASGLTMHYYKRTKKILTENNLKFIGILSVLALLLAYGLVFWGWVPPVYAVMAATGCVLAAAVFCLGYLLRDTSYGILCKKMLTTNAILFHAQETNASAKAVQKVTLGKMSQEAVQTGKKGYEYFNEIFLVRHKKILTRSARKIAAIAGVFMIGFLAWAAVSAEVSKDLNRIIMTFLPYFVFIMYCINRGQVVTQAMFMNCDHSMLAYRFYRQPETILSLFKVRLKTLIKINLLPAMVIACGLPLILLVSGGTDNPFNYLVLFVSILAMSVFFSVHHLMLYYLLQPYNVNMEAKSSAYTIANSVTYILCYLCIQFRAPTFLFASLAILFCLAYVGAALYLVYRFAPKRFRLK